MAGRSATSVDIFVSYSPADEAWATWIAWELEAAGYRTMIQAWDFVPGTNFIDFMDRGVREAAVVVAVLSDNYLQSRYGRMEWQAALRANPDDPSKKLVTVRLADCRLDGLLATITWVDLADVHDQEQARARLLDRIAETVAGRAKPSSSPAFPAQGDRVPALAVPRPRGDGAEALVRRGPMSRPAFPAADDARGPRERVTVLRVGGPRFGRALAEADDPLTAEELQSRIWADLTRMRDGGMPRPDLLVVSGDLTESGSLREFGQARMFLNGLRTLIGLESHRVVVVPGPRDVTKAACQAYFNNCEADDIRPAPPYWQKWRHFHGLFEEFYQGLEGVVFDASQPWTLFAMPDLRVVLAGLNSTMAMSHREADQYGLIGEAQAAWFAERLRPFEADRWMRIGVMGHAPAALRDAAVLDRLLGHRLTLLAHGDGPARSDPFPTVPSPGAGTHHVIEITPDGMRLWSPGAPPQRTPHRWRSCEGTFTDARAAEPAPPLLAPADHEPAPTPSDLLLDRVAEVCEARHERARVRRVDLSPPHLVVTYHEDGFVRQTRIGAHVGEVTEESVAEFLRHVYAAGPGQGVEVVYEGPPPARALRDDLSRRGVRLRSFTEFQGLVDLSGYVRDQSARIEADRRYPPGLYVPQRYRALDRAGQEVGEGLTDELIRLVSGDHGRFVLLLGDFGHGKSFALREVARRLPVELPHLIPILIELRSLDKAHSVDGLVAAHLADHGEDVIDLKAFHYLLRQGRIVLLFDGFDELVTRVTYDRAVDHLDTLIQAAEHKAKIIVASRTQHFKSQSQVLTALGEKVGSLPRRRVLSVTEFSGDQIRSYLVNRYDDAEAADARLALMSGVEDLLGLASNPRMLSFIADLPERNLRAVAGTRGTVSAARLYEAILGTWLAFEERRTSGVPGTPGGLRLPELWRAVTLLAMRLWQSGESYLRLTELTEIAQELADLAEGQLSAHQAAHAVGTGSLLVRTDEGLFGFIHTSVMEWLVARHIASVIDDPAPLSWRSLSQLTVEFLCDQVDVPACRTWAARVLADPAADAVARGNAVRISTRLRTSARADLRGADLRGQDLSSRDLREVDLTGADLGDATLVGADLHRAVLRDARLVGARLDKADLTGADLRGADLTRARLIRADLSGAALDGSRWHRAALIEVTGAAPGLPELRGAAVAPAHPVEIQLAPAGVGVPYGYHFQFSRLPSPVAYSPAGDLLALGSDDGLVVICDSITGLPIRTLAGHRDRAYAVSFSGDGGLLVSGAADGTVRLWDPSTGELLHTLAAHPDGVWPVLLSPDGSLVAAGGGDGVVRLWSTTDGRLLHELSGHGTPLYASAFDRTGETLLIGDGKATLRVWDTARGVIRRIVSDDGAGGSVYRAVYDPSGALLATGHKDGVVRLWNARDGRLLRRLVGHTTRVYALNFSPDGQVLASGDIGGELRLWDPATGAAAGTMPGRRAAIYQVSFSPDGSQLAWADSGGSVEIRDAATWTRRHALSGHRGAVWPFVFRPDGAQLATAGNDGTARLWDTATGQCQRVLRGHGRRISAVRFSADGSMLATCGNDGVVRVWDPHTCRRLHEFTGSADRMTSAVFSPAGPVLATASNDGGMHFWNVATGAYEREMSVETDHVWAEAFSPDGAQLATANDDDSVRIWSPASGRLITTLADHRGRVRWIDFSPGGELIATGCDDRAVRVWHVHTGQLVAMGDRHTDRVYAVAFNSDGTRLLSAGNDGLAVVWDPADALMRPATVLTHPGRLWTAAWSPGDHMIATAGDDLAVRLWDSATGDLLHTLPGHTRRIWSLAFSPDGTLLASSGDDGTAVLWNLDGPSPSKRATLLGLPEGWAALAPDGRYKQEGDIGGQFWHAVGMCRFEPGELDEHLPGVRRMPLEAEF
ncbi:TIR domain-containing protein [Sinosporangium siamense]|uniref:TIR domain-containing protein n=1 Tax=Sinosporangium siamense TaxID=1367973 RepID=A0A919RFE5_9ACTN|nr:TIR domain-containing protein [Sinosporangium siamense]GII92382.1 hypothetical protein Ssi02_26130 [Sinosporangium siamense]